MADIFLCVSEDQFIIAGFLVLFHVIDHTGQFCDDQFAGGVDDAAGTQVAANGLQGFIAEGDVQMAALCTDGTVEADDLIMSFYALDVHATGIPDSALQNAAHCTENHTGPDLFFCTQRPDGFQQVVASVKPQTVESDRSGGRKNSIYIHG